MEFYEDYYTDNKGAALEAEVSEDGDVQFVTGDPEVDELERRLAAGDITDEEVQDILNKWAGVKPDARAPESLVEDIGEGFDERPRR